MIKLKKVIICLGITLCILAAAASIMPLHEDPPSAISTPMYSYVIC